MKNDEQYLETYYDLVRIKLTDDLKKLSPEDVLKFVRSAQFTKLQILTLFTYCIAQEAYELSSVLKPLL